MFFLFEIGLEVAAAKVSMANHKESSHNGILEWNFNLSQHQGGAAYQSIQSTTLSSPDQALQLCPREVLGEACKLQQVHVLGHFLMLHHGACVEHPPWHPRPIMPMVPPLMSLLTVLVGPPHHLSPLPHHWAELFVLSTNKTSTVFSLRQVVHTLCLDQQCSKCKLFSSLYKKKKKIRNR